MLLRTILFLVIMLPSRSGAQIPALLEKLENTAVGQPGITEDEDEIPLLRARCKCPASVSFQLPKRSEPKPFRNGIFLPCI
jgi:hypothetical protein